MKPELIEDIALLKQVFQECYTYVQDSRHHRLYAEEKIHHSLQVMGAGNFILKHEKAFQNRNADFILKAQQAYLLHDIGRFAEIKNLYDDSKKTDNQNYNRKKYDHSALGADFLRNLPRYNHPLIIIPIKHHGHLIEDLYIDDEYTSITDEQLKKDIEKVIFLVRDADKTANFNLIKVDRQHFEELFYGEATGDVASTAIAPDLLAKFGKYQTIDKRVIRTIPERILGIIAWVYDMNYKASFDFMCRAGGVDFLIEKLGDYTNDKQLQQTVAKTIKNYITLRYHNFRELS